ncbi:esterase/lipase family protein [Pontiella sp.]|uniref:esterase/lipase family protein n=1 Tax=Pontiella sp. TaxID=2837462 RepID=UPI00356884F1
MAIGFVLMAGLLPAAAQTVPEPTETVNVDKCELYVYKAHDSVSAEFSNPVLFIEGFDLYDDQGGDELYTMFNKENLIEELRNQGRDVIILDYDDPSTRIQNNAVVTSNAVAYINSARTDLGPQNKFTVVGCSMGGLTSRLALSYFEDAGQPHYVDTWISFDAPHEGANVPLGLQEYADFFSQFSWASTNFLPLGDLKRALDGAAVDSMLLVHHKANTDAANTATHRVRRTQLIGELDRYGYPATCKKTAISNGSGLGEMHAFSPGDKIIQWRNNLLPWVDTDIYALAQSTGDDNVDKNRIIFDGLFYVYEGDQETALAHYPYPLDNAPGGTADIFGQIYASLDYIDGDDFCISSNHCFIPTVSSVGIPIEYIDTDLSQHPEVLALSPFDEVHLALENEVHLEINARNKHWFMQAILEEIDTDGDGLDDYTEYLLGTDYAGAQVNPPPTERVEIRQGLTYADLYISKADSNEPGLRNPVLFVEGFDLYNNQSWEELYTLFNQENLIEDLQQQGRDVLILNFANATTNLFENVPMLSQSITYIEQNHNCEAEKFTLIGAGMGGLISRLALTYYSMYEVDTWISFDAPHEGANVPLSLQKFGAFYTQLPDQPATLLPLAELMTKGLDSMAAKQMLRVHHSVWGEAAAATGERDGLVGELDRNGFPTGPRTIAISNGSGLGEKHPFDSGDQIMHWSNPALPGIDVDLYALPESDYTTASPLLFTGAYDGTETTNLAHYAYSLDNAPGGTLDLLGQVYSILPYIDDDDYCIAPDFCFVPTVSSLGIPIDNLESNLTDHTELLALSPFDEVHLALTNEKHLEINASNKRWFMRAVLEDIDSDGDGLDDYTEYFIGTDYASGESALNFNTEADFGTLSGQAVLTVETIPNVKYKIWFTEALDQPWVKLNNLSPRSEARTAQRTYDLTTPAGYYRITAEPIDPVTD